VITDQEPEIITVHHLCLKCQFAKEVWQRMKNSAGDPIRIPTDEDNSMEQWWTGGLFAARTDGQ